MAPTGATSSWARLAVQCHPEFKSKPTRAHPLFRGLVEASLKRREGKKKPDAGRARGSVGQAAVSGAS